MSSNIKTSVQLRVPLGRLAEIVKPANVPEGAQLGWCRSIEGGSQRDSELAGVLFEWVWDDWVDTEPDNEVEVERTG